jgi:hypothetical protein
MKSREKAHLYFTLQISNAVRVKPILIEKKKKETLEMSLTFFHVIIYKEYFALGVGKIGTTRYIIM